MKKVFITDFDSDKYKLREIFPLARPFFNPKTDKWGIDEENLVKTKCQGLEIKITSSPADADLIVISEPLNHDRDKNRYKEIAEINQLCLKKNILAYVYISGDYGKVHPRFSNIIYYRMGGFKSQLDDNNKAFFFLLSDHFKRFFNQDEIIIRQKEEKPTVGFCGHASFSIPKFFYEKFKLGQINLLRIREGDFNFEPLFSSAFERLNILKQIGSSKNINANFIFRKKYRAGAVTEHERLKTTKEYYQNTVDSDYIVCLRGSGNFSVRLYETLMMGRIPVFINTDCLLPLEGEIEWKNHVVWVEWKNRKNISKIIQDFHSRISSEEFVQLQKRNREIWKSYFTVAYYLKTILNA